VFIFCLIFSCSFSSTWVLYVSSPRFVTQAYPMHVPRCCLVSLLRWMFVFHSDVFAARSRGYSSNLRTAHNKLTTAVLRYLAVILKCLVSASSEVSGFYTSVQKSKLCSHDWSNAVVLNLFLLVAHFWVSITSVAPPLILFNYKKISYNKYLLYQLHFLFKTCITCL
jgi:hypothetical protein